MGRSPIRRARARPASATALVALALLGASQTAAAPLQCQARGGGVHTGAVPVVVQFEALAAGGNGPLSYDWSFGDGATSTNPNPLHAYLEGGVYQAVLTVNAAGVPPETCRDTALVLVNVFIDPLCGATASPRWSVDSEAIAFTAYPGLLGDPEPYAWSWWFGDGATEEGSGTFQFTEHAYAVPGTYWAVVTLHTPLASYPCLPTLRVTTLVPQGTTGVDPARITALALDAPRPNPFAAATTIGYALPRPGRARLAIVDPAGRLVATLADGERAAGRHVAIWSGRTGAGGVARPGLYVAVLEHEGETRSTRVVRVP